MLFVRLRKWRSPEALDRIWCNLPLGVVSYRRIERNADSGYPATLAAIPSDLNDLYIHLLKRIVKTRLQVQ